MTRIMKPLQVKVLDTIRRHGIIDSPDARRITLRYIRSVQIMRSMNDSTPSLMATLASNRAIKYEREFNSLPRYRRQAQAKAA